MGSPFGVGLMGAEYGVQRMWSPSTVLLKSKRRTLSRLHHALERHAMFAGKTGAVFVLGRRALAAVGQGGHLDGYLAPRRRHLLKAAWQANTLHDLATNAVGRGFQKDNRLQAVDILV